MVFPNFSGKQGESALVSPQDYLNYAKKVGKYPRFRPPFGVILCFKRSLLKSILETHKTKRVDFFGTELFLLKETKGKIAVTGRFGIGAPAIAVLVEELIAFGVKRFLSIGEAGSLQKSIKVGSVVVCDKAIRDEGTSHHYLKPAKFVFAQKAMLEKIKAALEDSGLKFVVGTTWTIDAPYRETVVEVKKYQREGVLVVEMEAAALFAVAQCRHVQAGAIFTISDYLAELEWKPKFHLSAKSLEKIFNATKNTLMQ